MLVHVTGRGNAAQKHCEVWKAQGAELVSYKEAELVDICSKPCDHFRQAKTALIAGKRVIVEKPPCGTLGELDELSDLGDIRVMAQYRNLDIDPIRLDHQWWLRDKDYYDGWRGDVDEALGGVLMSHGIHFIHWYIHNHGKPKAVEVHHVAYHNRGVEKFVGLLLDGFTMCFEVVIGAKFAHHNVPNPGYKDFMTDTVPILEYRPTMEIIEECYRQIRC